jgi:hypothetical protein
MSAFSHRIARCEGIVTRAALAVAGIVLLLTIPGTAHAAGCVSPPDGLVSWWPGDGDANDVVDGNHGTLVGGAAFASGEVGQAFSFDGTVGTRVAGPADSAGSNLDITGAFTLDAWVDFTAVNGTVNNAPIVAKWGTTSLGTAGYGIFMDSSGRPAVGVGTDDGWHRLWVVSPSSLSSGFHHVAGVFTGSEVRVYVDGDLEVSHGFDGPVPVNDIPVLIGGYDPSLTSAWGTLDGLIDEVDVFNRALSEAEIQAIYDAGSAGKCRCGPLPVHGAYGKLLFNRHCTRDAGGLPGGPGEPYVYDSKTLGIYKGTHDRFYLSSDGMSFAPLVVDEAIHINGIDCGLGPFEYQPGVPPFVYDVPIEENVVPRPAHAIADELMGVGPGQYTFELLDTQREIYGNTVIHLVRDCGIYLEKEEHVTINWVSHDVEIEGLQSNLDVVSGLLAELHEDGDFFHVCFLGSFIDTTQAVDARADPPPGDGYYYLVAGTCASPIGFGDSSLVPDPRDVLPVTYPCP